MKINSNHIDKTLKQLEQSEMLLKLVKKIGRIFFDEAPKPEIRTVEIEKIVEKPVERIVEKEKIVEKEVTPIWAINLQAYLPIIEQVQQYPKLANILLGNAQDAQQIVRFLVCGAQWTNVLRVWDALAGQVKQTQQPISNAEQQILECCLALYNQTLNDCQAQLQHVEQGISYNYEQHQRANNKGERVQTVLLQGLLNAADDVVRSAVVMTQ